VFIKHHHTKFQLPSSNGAADGGYY